MSVEKRKSVEFKMDVIRSIFVYFFICLLRLLVTPVNPESLAPSRLQNPSPQTSQIPSTPPPPPRMYEHTIVYPQLTFPYPKPRNKVCRDPVLQDVEGLLVCLVHLYLDVPDLVRVSFEN